MPIHDWKKADAGLFHAFHQAWIVHLAEALNRGVLPKGYSARPEQNIGGPIPDVLTFRRRGKRTQPGDERGGLAVAEMPPSASIISRAAAETYARKADRLTIRHPQGEVVAVIEIVSPGNKRGRIAFRDFVENAVNLIHHGVHVLIVDPLPPGRIDLRGIHAAIWDQFGDEESPAPRNKPLTLASYQAGVEQVAYVEYLRVGSELRDMPLFLSEEHYVPTPLEESYMTAWRALPEEDRDDLS